MESHNVNEEMIREKIDELIALCGGVNNAYDNQLVMQMIQTSLRFLSEGHDTGQLKLITRALKEMRYAYRVFNEHGGKRRISIFGSARTPEDHPDYLAAKELSIRMTDLEWMCITGAAAGIMKAGLEGHREDTGFGLSILLPFESGANAFIAGDPKLIKFRYFFTRKLMFMSHSDALAAFPGGVGTMDELFEALTLFQTGKANIIPAVLVEGKGGTYWAQWEEFIDRQFLANGWISAEDHHLYYRAKDPQDAVQHILHFYRRYHSNRYVQDMLVIRLKTPLHPKQIDYLNEKYSSLIVDGDIHPCVPFVEEMDHLDLPRIAFHHNKRHYGTLRALFDDINSFD